MKVIFEIDNNLLKAAAGVAAFQNPNEVAEIMSFAEDIGNEDIIVSQTVIDDMVNADKQYKQLPMLVAMVALAAKFMEMESDQ